MKGKNALPRERPAICEGQHLYARSPGCPQSKTIGKEESTGRKVTEKTTDSDTLNGFDQDVMRVEARTWSGPSKQARHKIIRKLQWEKKPRPNRWVTIYLGGKKERNIC